MKYKSERHEGILIRNILCICLWLCTRLDYLCIVVEMSSDFYLRISFMLRICIESIISLTKVNYRLAMILKFISFNSFTLMKREILFFFWSVGETQRKNLEASKFVYKEFLLTRFWKEKPQWMNNEKTEVIVRNKRVKTHS